jgi:hypothetical protein
MVEVYLRIERKCLLNAIYDHKLDFICIQEIKRSIYLILDYSLSGNHIFFFWICTPYDDASWGMLMGVKEGRHDVEECVTDRFYTRVLILCFKWNLVTFMEHLMTKINNTPISTLN